MSVLFKAMLAFAMAAALTGRLHLETPRWHVLAGEFHAAHPRAALNGQIQHLLAGQGI